MALDHDGFANLNFNKFRQAAMDDSLSCYEKIGFPDSYREGKEEQIFRDIVGKLKNLEKTNQLVIDIGPGCSHLPLMLIELCRSRNHQLILIDSDEMLSHLPDEPFITKAGCYYPQECSSLINEYENQVDVILSYSVLHYVFAEASTFRFIDESLRLMANGGEMLIGDIPNISKRKRFFSSPNGVKFHHEFMATEEDPVVNFNTLEAGEIDDAVILSLILKCRAAGADAYWLPQGDALPMANRREDVLIRKP
jgi:hypothetical protein